MDLIPAQAGVVLVKPRNVTKRTPNPELYAKVVRKAKANGSARKLTPAEVEKVARLGCMRIWDLKAKVIKARENSEGLE
jgi:rRNA maturation endonuclease Nob1